MELVGKDIIIPVCKDNGDKVLGKYRVDIGSFPGIVPHEGCIVHWCTSDQLRKTIKQKLGWGPCIVRVLYYRDGITPFIRDATAVCYFLGKEHNPSTGYKASGFKLLAEFSKDVKSGWTFKIGDPGMNESSRNVVKISTPEGVGRYYACDFELASVLYLVKNFHCVPHYNLLRLTKKAADILEGTKRTNPSPVIAAVVRALREPEYFSAEDMFQKIEVPKTKKASAKTVAEE